MAENILKGSIVITAPGLDQTATSVNNAVQKIGSEMQKMSASSYLARDAINDMSHELRDLPYALNNPSMLAGPFGKLQALFFDLKQQTGSTQGAFSALAGSLSGGGGLLLAGNLAVSLFAILGPKLLGTAEAAKTVGEKFKDIKKSLDEYTASLSPLNQAILKGKENSEEEILKLNTLYRATQNTTLSIKERKKATEELKDLFPSVFQGMSDEVIMNGKADKSYQQLKTTLLETAKAQALFDEAVDLSKQSDAAESKLKKANKELADLKKQLSSSLKVDLATSIADDVIDKEKERNKLAQDYLDINGQINDLQKKLDEHPTAVVKPKFDIPKVTIDKEQFIKRVREGIINDGIPQAFIKELTDTLWDNGKGIYLDYKPNPEYVKYLQKTIGSIVGNTAFNPLTGENGPKFHIDIVPEVDWQKGFVNMLKADELKKQLETLTNSIEKEVQNMATSVVAGLGQAIGEAITGNGGFADAFKGVFASLGSAVETLGEQLIQYGIAKEIAIESIRSLNPFAAIAAGFGLEILGSVIKSSFTKAQKFATGGFVPGGGSQDSVPAWLTPGEYIVSRNEINNLQNLVSTMRNLTSLTGSIQGLATMPNIKTVVEVGGEFRLSGNDLVSVITKINKKQGRSF